MGVTFRDAQGDDDVFVSTNNPLPVSSANTASAKVAGTAPATITVNNSASATLLAVNTSRRAFIVQNASGAADIFLGFHATAPTTANGIKIKAGEAYTDEGYTGIVKAIASVDGADVRVVEFS